MRPLSQLIKSWDGTHPSSAGNINRSIVVQTNLGIKVRLYLKNEVKKRGWGM
jgi:hypothetical protein